LFASVDESERRATNTDFNNLILLLTKYSPTQKRGHYVLFIQKNMTFFSPFAKGGIFRPLFCGALYYRYLSATAYQDYRMDNYDIKNI